MIKECLDDNNLWHFDDGTEVVCSLYEVIFIVGESALVNKWKHMLIIN